MTMKILEAHKKRYLKKNAYVFLIKKTPLNAGLGSKQQKF